jgi:hypothetical protein
MFSYFADNGPRLLAPREAQMAGASRAYTKLEATGVTLAVEPWNVPAYQAMRAAAPTLMLGNTILLKPAGLTVNSSLLFDEWFREAGFPEGVYQTALITSDQISRFIADRRVRSVTFTGSDRVGSIIGRQAGEHIKPVVLELGGSDPFIVLDSADVQRAAGLRRPDPPRQRRPDLRVAQARHRHRQGRRRVHRDVRGGLRRREGRRPVRPDDRGSARASPRRTSCRGCIRMPSTRARRSWCPAVVWTVPARSSRLRC